MLWVERALYLFVYAYLSRKNLGGSWDGAFKTIIQRKFLRDTWQAVAGWNCAGNGAIFEYVNNGAMSERMRGSEGSVDIHVKWKIVSVVYAVAVKCLGTM